MNNERTLLIDADDTLWDNNIHYENAIIDFVAIMNKNNMMKNEVEEILREREMTNVIHHGYGSKNFFISMLEVYKMACAHENCRINDNIIKKIEDLSIRTRDYPITLLAGVKETLPVLKRKNRLILVTKGDDEEQLAKVKRSGISHLFPEKRVVHEKNKGIYQEIIREFDLDPLWTWMVGNSPRSDINPAKAIGLGTVFIPYHNTWVHELEDIIEDGRETILLNDFSGLLNYFG